MIRISIALVVFAAALPANPDPPVILSEIETAPDSCERLELHQYTGFSPGARIDLSGAPLVTNAGVAVIDSGVVLPADSYVVIDSTNTTGVFSLGDDSDYIRLCVPGGYDTFRLRYPDNPHWTYERSWVPPPRMSAALHTWTVWDQYFIEWRFYTWYVDTTPTFGASNDDNGGGIRGLVLDPDSQPIAGATVQIASANGTATMQTESGTQLYQRGYFEERPTGPGKFVLTAEYPGYQPYTYPETINLAPNELQEIIIYLQRPGAVEERVKSATVFELRQRGRTLVLDADRPGTALVSVYDDLGRVRMSEKVTLISGSNDLALPSVGRGVYFANCRFGERTLNTKFVFY